MADDRNTYFADPGRIQAGVRRVERISSLAQEMVRDFVSTVNLTRDWPGVDDDFARDVGPHEKTERTSVTDTGQAVADAVAGVADGTTENLRNILGTQGNVLDEIERSARNGRRRH